MAWTVTNHDEFETEFDALPEAVQDELLALASLLETYGPALGRRSPTGKQGQGVRPAPLPAAHRTQFQIHHGW